LSRSPRGQSCAMAALANASTTHPVKQQAKILIDTLIDETIDVLPVPRPVCLARLRQ
jgi:hypothetical protein